jgi:hypothetical protein
LEEWGKREGFGGKKDRQIPYIIEFARKPRVFQVKGGDRLYLRSHAYFVGVGKKRL